jgi:hypothetical protein
MLTDIIGNTMTGYDLSNYTIYGGGSIKSVASAKITMLGGMINALVGGGYSGSVTESTNVAINGGTIADSVYGGCYDINMTAVAALRIGVDANISGSLTTSGYGSYTTGTGSYIEYEVAFYDQKNGNKYKTGVCTPQFVTKDAKAVLPSPALINAGKIIDSWINVSDDSNYDFNMPVTAPLKLYAVWVNMPTYTVTYNGNENTSGTVPTDNNTYLDGANVPLAGNTGSLAKTDYTFGGWSLAPNGTAVTTYTMGTSNVTFYAVWNASNQGGNNQPYVSSSSGSNSSSANKPAREPFLADTHGAGNIENRAKKAKDGESILINMNSTITLKSEWLEAIAGRDVNIVLDMGSGIKWAINGKSITGKNFSDVDLAVKTGTNKIPVDVINNLTGEKNVMQFTVTHSGEFGFTATLSIDLGKDNEGLYANLFYYNETTKTPEFISACIIGKDGSASWDLAHASTYAVIIDKVNLAPENVAPGAGTEANESLAASIL